jgi:hypothetical protein
VDVLAIFHVVRHSPAKFVILPTKIISALYFAATSVKLSPIWALENSSNSNNGNTIGTAFSIAICSNGSIKNSCSCSPASLKLHLCQLTAKEE